MAERNTNLLHNGANVATNGIKRDNVKQWYGGPITISASGTFNGATVEVLMGTRFPAGGDRAAFADTNAYPDSDFIPLASFTEPDTFDKENLNPCLLLIKVTAAGAQSKVRVTVS